jgi:hypothetical protein
MFKSRISLPIRIRFLKIPCYRPLRPYGFGFCKKSQKKKFHACVPLNCLLSLSSLGGGRAQDRPFLSLAGKGGGGGRGEGGGGRGWGRREEGGECMGGGTRNGRREVGPIFHYLHYFKNQQCFNIPLPGGNILKEAHALLLSSKIGSTSHSPC